VEQRARTQEVAVVHECTQIMLARAIRFHCAVESAWSAEAYRPHGKKTQQRWSRPAFPRTEKGQEGIVLSEDVEGGRS